MAAASKAVAYEKKPAPSRKRSDAWVIARLAKAERQHQQKNSAPLIANSVPRGGINESGGVRKNAASERYIGGIAASMRGRSARRSAYLAR